MKAHRRGYGVFRLDGHYWLAPRLAYVLTHGDIMPGLCVLHSCDNRRCCNPQHLRLGTLAENNQDRAHKGRTARQYGEKHGNAKLTNADVIAIRSLYARGTFTQRRLGALFHVSQTVVGDIVRRQAWPHI